MIVLLVESGDVFIHCKLGFFYKLQCVQTKIDSHIKRF